MEDKYKFSFFDDQSDSRLLQFLEAIEIIQKLGLLERDIHIRQLAEGLSLDLNDDRLWDAFIEKVKPYLVRDRLKPHVFAIPRRG